jgi:integrase
MARKAATPKPPRRKPNTGTIREKSGRAQPWEAAFPIGHGQHRYDYFSTRPAAEAHLDILVAERDHAETPRNIAGGSRRVDQFLPQWLETKRGLKPTTFHSYTYYCELASGQIGARRLDTVDRECANGMLAYFERRGFQNTAQMRACLLQAFEYALDEGYIKKNPFRKVKVAAVERRIGIALTLEQRTDLLELAITEDRLRGDEATIPLYPLWHIYSRLGFRRGEGIALLWGKSGVNLEAGTITVSRQITTTGKGQIDSTPKTKRSNRTIPIPLDLLELLKQHKEQQIKRAAADLKWENHSLVFPDEHGRPMSYWYIQARWNKLRRRAGFPDVNIHDLRHTALWLLENDGAPPNVVQAVAGHASQTMTRHYVDHADMDSMRRALGA